MDRFVDDLEILQDRIEKENKRGERELIGQCPDFWGMHKNGDTTGKFALNMDKRVYNCFVCGGGSLIDLVMMAFDLDAESAIDWLMPLADDSTKPDGQWADDMTRLLATLGQSQPEDVLPYYNPRVLAKYDANWDELLLWNAGHWDGKPKNIDTGALSASGARFAPDMLKYAPRDKRTGLPIDDAYQGPCIIFPHYVGDRLVGWQNRWLETDRPKWVAKYTNTPDFPKRFTLFRPRRAPSHLPVVVVESVPTSLFVSGLDWPSVGTFGATVTPEQMKLLRRFQQGVIIAPDNDKPGVEGLVKMADYLDGFIPVSYVEPDGGPGDDLMDLAPHTDVRALLHGAIRIS